MTSQTMIPSIVPNNGLKNCNYEGMQMWSLLWLGTNWTLLKSGLWKLRRHKLMQRRMGSFTWRQVQRQITKLPNCLSALAPSFPSAVRHHQVQAILTYLPAPERQKKVNPVARDGASDALMPPPPSPPPPRPLGHHILWEGCWSSSLPSSSLRVVSPGPCCLVSDWACYTPVGSNLPALPKGATSLLRTFWDFGVAHMSQGNANDRQLFIVHNFAFFLT